MRVSVDSSFEGLIDQLQSKHSKRTYRADWVRYLAWCKKRKLDVRRAKPRDVMAHLAQLQKDGKAKSTIGRALSVIREVYAAFVRDELMATNPAREVKPPRMSGTPKTPWLDEESMSKVLNLPAKTWEEKRDRVAAFLLFGLGWRRSEIARMRLEEKGYAGEWPFSIFLPNGTCCAILKGGKEHTVGVPEWVQDAVVEWCAFANIRIGMALLPRWDNDPAPISDGMLYKIVKKIARRAGLDKSKVTPHGFRRSFITLGGAKGVDLKKRQLAAGHSSSATTEKYDRAREAAANAPGEVFAGMIKSGRRK